MKIQELKDKLPGLLAKAQAYLATADAENRAPSEEELKDSNDTMAIYEATERQITLLDRAEAAQARLDAPGERRVRPETNVAPQGGAPGAARQPVITGGEPTAAAKGTGGFKSFGEFAKSVRAAVAAPSHADRRLDVRILNAASTFGSEGIGADGGYLVPPDFRTDILEKVMAEDSLLSKTDQQTTTSNSMTFPADEISPWDSSAAMQTFWEGEGQTGTQVKPGLQSNMIRTFKIMTLVGVTDELLSDAPALEGWLRKKAPTRINYKINDAIINGDGVGKPLGLLKSPALITQAAEGSQAAGTVNYLNISKMYSRVPESNRRNAVWITNQDIEPQLDSLVVPGTQPAFPAYLPAGGLSAAPYPTLKGRPVIYSEATAAIGTPGDILFADLTQYMSVVKAGGIRTDVSMHLWFDADQTAFRFVLRIGGLPWWSKTIARPGGKNPYSAYIALAQR